MVCRRCDGREVRLGDLFNAETLRALTKEVEVSVPGGVSVRTLIDATPIRAEGSAVERVVVTLQGVVSSRATTPRCS